MSSLYSPALRDEMEQASGDALENTAKRLADAALSQLEIFGGVPPERDTLIQEYRELLEDAG